MALEVVDVQGNARLVAADERDNDGPGVDPALSGRLMARGFRFEEIAPLIRRAEAAGVDDVERYVIKELIG